jgi:hypothetical protein
MISRRSAIKSALALAALGLSAEAETLHIGGATLNVSLGSGDCDLPASALLDWISTGAHALTAYFGKFPVPSARIEITIAPNRHGVQRGKSFGDNGALTTITVGQHVTVAELHEDWVLTHEMVHWAFPSVARRHHWIEEGSATYIEPIARALVHNLTPQRIWGDMLRDMHQGVPGPDEQGLDNTRSWASTYWGGALFCLLADVQIRKQTQNRKGIQDAFRAINQAGGDIGVEWPLEKAFEIGDRATDGSTLQDLYQQMGLHYKQIDLPALWQQLGVGSNSDGVRFDDSAPLASLRRSIAG